MRQEGLIQILNVSSIFLEETSFSQEDSVVIV